ncbi:MAG: putative transporter [Bacteroidales bacterium]
MNEWLSGIFLNIGDKATNIGQTMLMLALTIALGIYLGRFKVKGISLGITWVLFIGIILSHFGHTFLVSQGITDRYFVDPKIFGFIKEFGLILFVYAIGLQVGPNFFSSLRQGGLNLNLMALLVIVLACITTIVIGIITDTPLEIMTGIMTGAVTNTPSLGAAQQTLADSGKDGAFLSSAYAVAYPLAVIGIIFVPMIVRYIGKINVKKEEEMARNKAKIKPNGIAIRVTNDKWDKLTIGEFLKLFDKPATVTRIKNDKGIIMPATRDTVINTGNTLRVVVLPEYKEEIIRTLGVECELNDKEWDIDNGKLEAHRIVVTNKEIQGRTLYSLHLEMLYNITIARIIRAGVELVPNDDLQLQLGDRVKVVGSDENIKKVAEKLGNSLKKLDVPNLIPIFLGIFLGVIFGLIPIKFPGIPQPVKLGLAGGPLIVAILLSRFGPMYKVVTFVTSSANMMIREIGIALFLAAVGLTCGDNFVSTIVDGGYMWVVYGFIITFVPIIITTVISRWLFKFPYYTIVGMIAGSHTDPPALAFANNSTETDQPATAYATVYPLSMFLRIFAAQILILISL